MLCLLNIFVAQLLPLEVSACKTCQLPMTVSVGRSIVLVTMNGEFYTFSFKKNNNFINLTCEHAYSCREQWTLTNTNILLLNYVLWHYYHFRSLWSCPPWSTLSMLCLSLDTCAGRRCAKWVLARDGQLQQPVSCWRFPVIPGVKNVSTWTVPSGIYHNARQKKQPLWKSEYRVWH